MKIGLFKKLGFVRGGFLLGAGAVLAIAVLVMQQPMETYASIDPGLDSGNATVDRTSVPGQTILKYTTTGNSTFKAPAGVTDVRVLVVGGGGGGGAGESLSGGDGGGGAGAGELLAQPTVTVTTGTAMTVTVGNGGGGSTTKQPDGGTTAQNGTNGGNSVFGALTARGGGGGGGNDQSGLAGGSGGGAGGGCSNNPTGGGSTAVSPGVGNGGGSPSSGCGTRGGAGGGGANAAGTDASGTGGATGGAGLQNDITGVSALYAAGANGGTVNTNATGAAGVANTGSGGAGGGSGTSTTAGFGGNGGSGVVIVRFTTQTFPDPGGVPGAVMWYKADTGGNTNAQWNDESGFNHNLTQGTAANQPVLTTDTLNFNPAYVFDGSDDVFSMPTQGVGNSESMSAFYAATSTRTDGGYRYFNEFGDDRPSISLHNGKPNLYVRDTSSVEDEFGTTEALTPRVYSFVSPNGGGSKVIGVDNREQTKSITGSYTTSGSASGNSFGNRNASSGTGWAGPIGEAIYFNRQLSAIERQQVNSYLALKYGVSLGTGTIGMDYLDSTRATIWPSDNTYKNNIAGIGRDDTSTLSQKQSKSEADGSLVAIGHGDIAATNQANTNDFTNDKTFMIWGNNNATTDQDTTVSGTSLVRMGRVWKMVVTNTVGAVKVQIPTSIMTRSTATLLVSNSATFDDSSQQVPMSVNGANYEATTTLAAGTHYFTFASEAGADVEVTNKAATTPSGTAITDYVPGQPLDYNITVRNNGPDDAGLITVTDTLPDGIVPTTGGSTGDAWSCNVASLTVTCTLQSLAAGATAEDITIEATVASSVTGQKVNTATASEASDPDTSNNSASVTLDAAPQADLSMTKEDVGTPVGGQTFDYKFTVTNNGPSDTPSFTITDTLPTDVTYDSGPTICDGSSGANVSCTANAPLAAGDSQEVTITVLVGGGYGGGDLTNTATVAVPSGVTDPVPGNNDADNNTNVAVSTDLTVNKAHSPTNFIAGDDNNTFTINATNNGPSDAPSGSITITDTLDEDFTSVTVDGAPDWACNPPGNTTVSCTYNAALTSGSTTPDITITVLVDSIAKGEVTNTANVSGTTPDPDLTNNSFPDTVTIEADADLAIQKDHVGTAFTAGEQGQYTFSVTNNGPSADTPSYKITDTLPAGLTYAGYTGDADCSPSSGQNVECDGGGILANDPAQVTTITVNVDAGATGSFNNTATVAPHSSVTDTNTANNTDDDTAPIEPNADLSIVKTPPATMTAGDTVDYTVTVTNDGPSDVSSFTVSDTLDSNLTFDSVGSDPGCNASGQDVTCTGGTLTSGSNVDITVSATVAATATNGANIANTADVVVPAGVNDPNSANNSSPPVNNTVETSADLAITKDHPPGNFTVGSQGTYTLSVTNNGTSNASTTTITDVLPDGLTYVSAVSTPAAAADCSNAGQTVTCLIGPTFGSGETVDITLTVMVDADVTATSIENTASIASATPDPTPANNNNSDTVTIDPATADLTATKTTQGLLTAGEPVTYRFEVTNNGGPDNAGVVTITDTLPSYLSYQSFNSVSDGAWDCGGSSGQDVTCTLGVLAVNDTAVVDVTVLVAQDAPDTADNSASVTFNGTDPTPANPSTSDSVSHSADLEVTITHEEKTYGSGDTIDLTYTVMNHGPSAAQDVVLTGNIPDGVTITNISATEPGGSSILSALDNLFFPRVHAADNPFACSLNGQIVCNASTLFVGTYPLYVTAQIGDSFTGELVFTASITSSTADPNSADTTATDTVESVLAATGQSILPWITGALAAIVAAIGFLLYLRRSSRASA